MKIGAMHLTLNAVGQAKLFQADVDRYEFLDLSKTVLEDRLLAFVLMGTHAHLVVEGERDVVDRLVHRLVDEYTARFAARYVSRASS